MVAIENKEKKEIENRICVCTQSTGLFIPSQQLSYYIAGSLLLLFFMFMAGFFCGKQVTLKTYLHSIEQDFFADQISYSLCRLPDTLIQVTDKQEDKCDNKYEDKYSEYDTNEYSNEEESVEDVDAL